MGSGIVALLALLAGVALLAPRVLRDPTPTPVPTPKPLVTAAGGDLRAHPEVPEEIRARIASELEGFLTDLYERAFLPPLPAPTPAPEDPPSPAPTPVPRPPIGDLFTGEAGTALADAPNVYGTAPRETVFGGEVTFDGIVTVQGEGATDALLNVAFDGRGRIEIEPPDLEEGELGRYHDMRLHQVGWLQAIRTAEGWRVSGFDIRLRSEELVPPSPGPEAAPFRAIEARWMP